MWEMSCQKGGSHALYVVEAVDDAKKCFSAMRLVELLVAILTHFAITSVMMVAVVLVLRFLGSSPLHHQHYQGYWDLYLFVFLPMPQMKKCWLQI
jgi:hypothetical protein